VEALRELPARKPAAGRESCARGSFACPASPLDLKSSIQICVDSRKQTVILPINGYAVPFHIKSIKNAIKQEEGDYTTIRVMFITPGQLTGKKEDTPFEDIGANFIRALTYRSTDSARFSEVYKEITELRKEATKRENERREAADIVDQEKLVEGRRARLHDTWLRPPFEGKRSTGDVEIHQNGIRWSSKARSDHKLDVTFANIKHLFFQPCDNELVVLVHVHLKSPIMLGKKKVKDVQFYREATDAAFDETGNRKRRRQHEEDEIELEQEERRQRASLNKEFKAFADKIADAVRVIVCPGTPSDACCSRMDAARSTFRSANLRSRACLSRPTCTSSLPPTLWSTCPSCLS
jgi:nucleosome binding factor SPN SPT16 subunit